MTRDVERSYGIIPLRKEFGEWRVLLVKHQAGHWAFPKGHAEEGENPYETAVRELKEETSLYIVEQLDPLPLQENYLFRKKDLIIYKLVDYFLASVGGKVEILKKELSDFEWVNLPEAKDKVTFKEAKKLCADIENRLKIPL